MSNALAIATVSETLRQLLDAAAKEVVSGAGATLARPDKANDDAPPPEIRLFLYQAGPNAAFRNADLPTRGSAGALGQRPVAALDLDYLISFYGAEGELQPHRLLGGAVRTLHASPILSPERIRAAVKTLTDGDPAHFLRDSDLADQVETVRLIPLGLGLEELSKLWSVFFQVPYTLSVAVRASLVLIESLHTPVSPLPVRAPLLSGRILRQPEIDAVVAASGDADPLVPGATALVRGRLLAADGVQLRLGGALAAPASATERELRFVLAEPPFPDDALRAGVHPLQVVHTVPLGEPEQPRAIVESNAAALILRPLVQAAHAGSTLTLTLDPPVGATQRVVVLLNALGADPPRSLRIEAPPRDDTETQLALATDEIESGTYLVRVQVDGAESPLDVDEDDASPTFGRFVGPAVTIP